MSNTLMFKKEKTELQKKVYAIIFLFFMFGMSINYYLNYFLQNVIDRELSVSFICYGLLTVLGVMILLLSVIRKTAYLFFFFLVLFGTFFSALIYPNVSRIFTNFLNPAYSKVFSLYFYCLPMLFFTIDNWEDIREYVYRYLFIFSFVCLTIGLLDWFIYLRNHFSLEYMTFSYNMLMPVVACFCYSKFRSPGIISLLSIMLGIIGVACILISGARGALICCFISLLLLFFIGETKQSTKVLLFVFLFVVIVVFFIRYESIVSWLHNTANRLGVRTRTLDSLSNNSMFESYGREIRIRTSLEGVLKNPFGYGFYGDWYLNNSYSHNIVIEMIVDFGIIIGPAILVWILYSLISMLKSSDKFFITIIASYGLFHLLFSGSFMWHVWFYMTMGLFYHHKKYKRIHHIRKQ